MNKTNTKFSNWLTTFLDEKGIDIEAQIFECDIGGMWGHAIIMGGVLLEGLHAAPTSEQTAIKDMLVKIDFHNGDVMDFMQHLATSMAKVQFGA